jgi:hypothetical protein
MRKIGISAVMLVIAFLAFGPVVFPQPPSMVPPNLQRQPRSPDEAAYRQIQIQREMERQQQNIMRSGESIARRSRFPGEQPLPITREERKRFAALMEPDEADLQRYKELLDQPRTGIFRLFPNTDCVQRGVIRADGSCAKFVPGGSSNTFRSGATTPDIHYVNGRVLAQGFFSQQMAVELGDVPIESVTLLTKGVPYLVDFQPSTEIVTVREQFKKISKGLRDRDLTYSNRITPKLDTTYALRIVAYRNSNNLRSRFGLNGQVLDEDALGFETIRGDHRTDIVVAFRVVRAENDGILTIVWRELSRQKSPLLNFAKDEPMEDFRSPK